MRKIVFCTLIALAPVAASAQEACIAMQFVDDRCEFLVNSYAGDLCAERNKAACLAAKNTSAHTERRKLRLTRLLVRAQNALTQCQANAKGKRALRRCNGFQSAINRILNALDDLT